MIGQLCLDVYLLKLGNLYTQSATYKPAMNHRISESVLLSILNLFIIISMEFLNYELSTISTIYSIISVHIQPKYYYLIFRNAVSANNMN